MATVWFFLSARDCSAAGQGARLTGLTPTWVLFKSLDSNADISPQPAIVEVGQGIYKFAYDAEMYGDAVAQVDVLGGANPSALVLNPADRYLDTLATRESSRILTALNPSGQVRLAPEGLDAVPVETGINARQALTPILAASAGALLGAGTGTVVIKGANVSDTRITATTDTAGNRTAVTLSLPPAQIGNTTGPGLKISTFFPSSYYTDDYFPFGKGLQV
jgi:hypothetical protein